MPHSSIKFKNENEYSLFTQMANFHSKPELIDLKLESTKNKVSVWMDAAVITMFSFGFFISLDSELTHQIVNSLLLIKANQNEPTLFQSRKIIDDKGFSLHHTFMYEINENTSIKFLFNKDWNINEFNTACEILIRELKAYEKNEVSQISEVVNTHLNSELILMSIDVNFDVIYLIN
ncbi:hypothetical protein HI850_014810 [bacterium SPL81]|nr:hypothetical protein [Acinetobacter baumannii]